jgi:hypothetical protein
MRAPTFKGYSDPSLSSKGLFKMIDKTDFQAFEERMAQLASAIVVTLLATGITAFVVFFVDLV